MVEWGMLREGEPTPSPWGKWEKSQPHRIYIGHVTVESSHPMSISWERKSKISSLKNCIFCRFLNYSMSLTNHSISIRSYWSVVSAQMENMQNRPAIPFLLANMYWLNRGVADQIVIRKNSQLGRERNPRTYPGIWCWNYPRPESDLSCALPSFNDIHFSPFL